ncbi:hypothetical protein G7Y79_00002g008390 [Physcia stellaris]|nr:hypothetical protein G7Y79_00002g008390 [Physcia stellaris]
MSGFTRLDRHSPERDFEDPLQSRASKLEGRMAELVMQIEILLREGLIRRNDKVLQVASDCVPPETDSQSTAMDLRSLLSQMQSERPGTSCTGHVSVHSDTEAKSTTQKMGGSNTPQGGSHLRQRSGAAVVFSGEKKSSDDLGSDVKNATLNHTPTVFSLGYLSGKASDPDEANGLDSHHKGECCQDKVVERASKAKDTSTRSKIVPPSRQRPRTNSPIPKGPRSRHLPPSQTSGIEIQIPMRKHNPIPRWHVGHSERQRRREMSAWRVGGTYSYNGDSDDALQTVRVNGREVSTIPSYEFYGTSQLTAKQPVTTSLTESSTTTSIASSDYHGLNNGEVTHTFPWTQHRKSEKAKNLIEPAEFSKPTPKRHNSNAPHDPICSSSQTPTKKRRHMRQDSSESSSSSTHQSKRLKSIDRSQCPPDRLAEDSSDGQLSINPRNSAGALTSSRASPKGKGKATQPLGVSSPLGSETLSSDTARDMDSSPTDTDAPSLDPGALHNQSKLNDAPLTNSAQPDILGHDPLLTNEDDDSETIHLRRLQPFPTVSSSRAVLNDFSLNIPSMRFQSMPPPRPMTTPLHRRLLPPQTSDILPLSIKESVRKALKECIQENQMNLQALQPQLPPQPVFANPLPPPGVVRQRRDSHDFGNLNQEQVITIIKNPNLGPSARFASAPRIFTCKGKVCERFQWLGERGYFTEPEWKKVGGKMERYRPRAE